MARSGDTGTDATIQSVARTFQLLERLSEVGSASLGQLSHAVGLPKPTILRMMRTLAQGGYVHQASRRSDYRMTSKLHRLGAAFSGLPAILEAAVDIADRITAELLWPVSIATREGSMTVVRYSTIPTSPYAHARSTVGKRLPLWTSAHGKAWLSHLPIDERPEPPAPGPMNAESAEQLIAELGHVRNRGYAIRTLGRDPSTNTIAVPIFENGRVAATLGMTYFSRILGTPAVRAMANRLVEAAREIEGQLSGQPDCPNCSRRTAVPHDGITRP